MENKPGGTLPLIEEESASSVGGFTVGTSRNNSRLEDPTTNDRSRRPSRIALNKSPVLSTNLSGWDKLKYLNNNCKGGLKTVVTEEEEDNFENERMQETGTHIALEPSNPPALGIPHDRTLVIPETVVPGQNLQPSRIMAIKSKLREINHQQHELLEELNQLLGV